MDMSTTSLLPTPSSSQAMSNDPLPSAPQGGEVKGLTEVPKEWLDDIQRWYPDLLEKTHFLPHIYMHRTLLSDREEANVMKEEAGEEQGEKQEGGSKQKQAKSAQTGRSKGRSRQKKKLEKIRKPPLDKHVQEDQAQQATLDCLRKLSEERREIMFVLSQMMFGDYLGKSSYNPAAKHFPRPIDLKSQGMHKGEYDLIVIHRQYGLMFAEIKSVEASAPEDVLVKRVWEAVDQIRRGKKVLKHIASDCTPPPRLHATLMLPNIPSSLLQGVLNDNPDLKQALCECLDVDTRADPVNKILCEDQMSSPDDWWENVLAGAGNDPAMSDKLYENLVARFAGPATLVRVYLQTEPRMKVTDMRSAGDFVSETGERLTVLALYPYQVNLINAAPDLAYLAGPPGTGKTVTTVTMGMEWLRRNKTVDILSGDEDCRAVSIMISQQLKKTSKLVIGPEAEKRVRGLQVNLINDENRKDRTKLASTVEALATRLTERAIDNEIFLIVDEAAEFRDGLDALYQALISRNIDVHLWAASLKPSAAPTCLKEHIHLMTVPLRSPLHVVQEIMEAYDFSMGNVPHYTVPTIPLPAHGPHVKILCHQGPGHEAEFNRDCEACGCEVGRYLKRVLHVGEQGNSALKYRDVFVLSVYLPLSDENIPDREEDQTDSADDETDAKEFLRPLGSGAVRGLRRAGVPVRVVRFGVNDPGVKELGRMAGPDCVTFTRYTNVHGLERKVVVWMEDVSGIGWTVDDLYGRLYGISRATSQLIWVSAKPRGSADVIDFSVMGNIFLNGNVDDDFANDDARDVPLPP